MVSHRNNTMSFLIDRKDVVQFAPVIIRNLRQDLPWIITMRPVRYGDSSVITVTEGSLEDTETPDFYDALQTILNKEQAGSYQSENGQ